MKDIMADMRLVRYAEARKISSFYSFLERAHIKFLHLRHHYYICLLLACVSLYYKYICHILYRCPKRPVLEVHSNYSSIFFNIHITFFGKPRTLYYQRLKPKGSDKQYISISVPLNKNESRRLQLLRNDEIVCEPTDMATKFIGPLYIIKKNRLLELMIM